MFLAKSNIYHTWRLRRNAFTAEAQRREGTQSLIDDLYLRGPLRLRASAVNDCSEAAIIRNFETGVPAIIINLSLFGNPH